MRLTLMAERADGYACGKHEGTKRRRHEKYLVCFLRVFVASYLRIFVIARQRTVSSVQRAGERC